MDVCVCVCVCVRVCVFQRGDKVAVTGYWGDIVTSPYLCFGVETPDQSLLKTENGSHIKANTP